jgi:hypothetical protein
MIAVKSKKNAKRVFIVAKLNGIFNVHYSVGKKTYLPVAKMSVSRLFL